MPRFMTNGSNAAKDSIVEFDDLLDILELINFINKGSLGSGEGLDSVDQAFASDNFYFSLDFDQAEPNIRNPRKPFKFKRGS